MYPENKSIWKKSFKEIWHDFKEYLKTPEGKKKFLIFCIVFVLLLTAGFTIYYRYFYVKKIDSTVKDNPLPKISKESAVPEPKKLASYLDGKMYLEETANRHPLAIMIENHPDSRPQSGLNKANIVYEAITEGGITRFMAIFGPESVSKVGPVRSARTYFLDWDIEYDAFYAHVGGNLDALELIPQIGVKDLDQFRYGTEAYWRIPQKGKATEHTMYTDTDKLWEIAKNNGWDMNSSFDSMEFKENSAKDQRVESQEATINFSTPGYSVKWTYDKEGNNYKRNLAGIPHIDAETGDQLRANNIIIQEVQRWYAPTSINEEGWAMKTIGEGNAKIIIDGKVIEATWKKADRKSRTIFYDSEGNKIKFNKGVSWYEIIPSGTPVSIE